MAAFWPHSLRPSLLRRRVPIRVLQPFHVPHHPRNEPEPLDPTKQIHLSAGLIAVACGKNDPMLARIDLKDRTDGRVHLGIHQHDRFPELECLENDLRAELDRARHIDENIDLGGPADRNGIFARQPACPAGSPRRERSACRRSPHPCSPSTHRHGWPAPGGGCRPQTSACPARCSRSGWSAPVP